MRKHAEVIKELAGYLMKADSMDQRRELIDHLVYLIKCEEDFARETEKAKVNISLWDRARG